MRQQRAPRRGASLVEFALVAPVTFFLMIGLLVGGMGIFRYQEVSTLAREAARYASVHGTGYASDTGKPAATATDVYNNGIVANNVSLDLSQVNYTVTWNTSNRPYHTKIVNGNVMRVTNTVKVTIIYQWMPEALLGGITMTSTAETAMCN
jgi:Flp pilus assembly protein TadG